MSAHYGQSIKYGVLDAPALFTGDNMSFSYRRGVTADDQENGGSDIAAIAMHSKKADLSFSGEVTSGSTDFLNLSAGARLAVEAEIAGIDLATGMILAYEAVEEWNLLRRKLCSVRAFHYPDFPLDEDTGASAGTTLSAFTPGSQSLDFLFPGNTLIYSTVGITHAAGLVHQLRITQQLTITDDDPSPNGKLLGAFSSGYKRMISLLLLAKPADAAIPEPASVLTLTGAPSHAANYRVVSAEPRMERKKGMMFQIDAVWIPPFSA
jgi:hypothetical protein